MKSCYLGCNKFLDILNALCQQRMKYDVLQGLCLGEIFYEHFYTEWSYVTDSLSIFEDIAECDWSTQFSR